MKSGGTHFFKSFWKKSEASAWAYKVEAQIEVGSYLEVRNQNKLNEGLYELFLKTNLETTETSKDSKGKTLSYRTTIYVDFKIKKNDKIIKNKEIIKDISYSNKENKFELVEFQRQITSNLVQTATEEIILFLNLE